jgi:hypothetical protein
MWWPRLKTQVAEIISSHDKGGRKEHRSERDILEEVLELTRMSVSGQQRTPRFSGRAFADLMETLDEMVFMMMRWGPDEMDLHMMERLDRPVRDLSMEAGMPELYERHGMRMKEMFARMVEKGEKPERGSPGRKK